METGTAESQLPPTQTSQEQLPPSVKVNPQQPVIPYSIYSSSSYSLFGKSSFSSGNFHEIFVNIFSQILNTAVDPEVELEIIDSGISDVLFDLTWKFMFNILNQTRKFAIVSGRAKPIIGDMVQAIRLSEFGSFINWLALLPKRHPIPCNITFNDDVLKNEPIENLDFVKDGLPLLPPIHTYRSTPVYVQRSFDQTKIITKTSYEKIRLEKNLRHLLQVSRATVSIVNSSFQNRPDRNDNFLLKRIRITPGAPERNTF